MRILLTFTIFLSAALYLSSCQREVDGRLDAVVNANDSIYLSKYIELDTLNAPGLDTSTIGQYYYDSQKRLIQIAYIGFDSGTHTIDFKDNEYRFYTGNDTVPYKFVSYQEDIMQANTYTDTNFLFYNNAGAIIKDSVMSYTNGNLSQRKMILLSQNGVNHYLVLRTTFDPLTGAVVNRDSIVSKIIITNKNITSRTDTTYNMGVFLSSSDYQATFNLNLSPFAKIALPLLFEQTDVANTTYSQSLNVPVYQLTKFFFSGATTLYTDNYTYESNTLGFPVVLRYTETVSSPFSASYVKVLLFYTD